MAITTKFETHPKYVFATNTGTNADYADSIAYGRSLFAACKHAQRVQLLVDDRAALHTVPPGAVYEVAEQIQNSLGALRIQRVACVPSPASLEITELFATMMNSRGVKFELFETLEAAQAWLEAGGS